MMMTSEGSVQEKAFLQNSNDYRERALVSARQLLPHVFHLVHPKSVVDFGCGGGAWLSVCQELGVTDVLGVDGAYVDSTKLLISDSHFYAHDLRQPLALPRKFDLAISLEVAEHIPSNASRTYVESLVTLSPVILFSAAIPFQGGVGHVNEQWPTYWQALFMERNYHVVDCIRKIVWTNQQVDTWYKQNTMLIVDADYLATHATLHAEYEISKSFPIDVVHPNRYLEEADPTCIDARKVPFKTARQALGIQMKQALHKALHWRIRRLLGI